MSRHSTILLVALFLLGCASIPPPEARRQHAVQLAAAQGWRGLSIQVPGFALQAFVPSREFRAETLVVYLEGDGLAWISGATPSADPTPRDPLALRLALAHPGGQAVYLGRPCQYGDAERSGCAMRYWTNARFAEPVVQAMSQAVDQLKARHGARALVLVGYSGGGAVAALLAARRDDVVRLVTVAGNLDHAAWTAHHRVRPLAASLNPADVAERLRRIPQTHFIGARDRVISPQLAENWPQSISGSGRRNLVILPDTDHACCWADHWPSLLKSPLFDWPTPKSADLL